MKWMTCLVQNYNIYSGLALEILQYCAQTSVWCFIYFSEEALRFRSERTGRKDHHHGRHGQCGLNGDILKEISKFCAYYCEHLHIYGLVQDCGISSASALEIPQTCTQPLISSFNKISGLTWRFSINCTNQA